MSADDLTSIPGLGLNHARGLEKLQINTYRKLAAADRDEIYRALRRYKDPPRREDIAGWQEEAARRLGAPVADAPDSEPAASFVVEFSRRHAGGGWERQLQVERTRVWPPIPPFVQSGWDCGPAWDWMLGQLPEHEGEQVPATSASDDDQAGSSGKPGSPPQPQETRGRLRIEGAVVKDATGQADLMRAGEITADASAELISPDRLTVTVTGAQHGREVLAVARIRVCGKPEWGSADPVAADPSGQAELSLPPTDPGEHDIEVVAWAPDASAYLASVLLPGVTVRPAENAS